MNPDDRLKKSSQRLNAELDRMTVPAPPSAGGNKVFAFAVGAVATAAVIAGGAYLLGSTPDQAPIAGGGSTTTSLPDTTGTTVGVPDGAVNYQGTVTVLDDGDGPVVCAGGVAESYPPQCDGPALIGLDWADVDGYESANGVKWADMAIEVSLEDDGSLTLVGDPAEGQYPTGEDIDFTPPCPAPADGWYWVDGPKTSQADFDAAMAYVQSQPDLSATWVYNLIDDPYEADESGRFEVVLVALFNGDLARHQSEIEALWGGPICVDEGTTNTADLQELQNELTEKMMDGTVPGVIGFGYSYVDEVTGTVSVGTLIATPEAYQWIADNYGDAPVRLESQLAPVAVEVKEEWNEPSSYSFVLESTCGERALIGVFEIEVIDNEVANVIGRDDQATAMLESSGLDPVLTIAEMLDEAATARSSGADDVTISYSSDGTPEYISIDREANAIDDESCYWISEYSADGQ